MATNKLLSQMQRIVTAPGFWWAHDPQLWVELFVTVNLAILAADIYIAHSVNEFQKRAEYIPLAFSLAAPPVLGILIGICWTWKVRRPWHDAGYLFGALSILVGLGGVLYHLESRFFLDRTLKSLTYAAPFAAPLAYTGLGFLLLVNRMVIPRSAEWARWVMFMALGGFFGNFVLSLTDHAENGFFQSTEWIPCDLLRVRDRLSYCRNRLAHYAPVPRYLRRGHDHPGVSWRYRLLVPRPGQSH